MSGGIVSSRGGLLSPVLAVVLIITRGRGVHLRGHDGGDVRAVSKLAEGLFKGAQSVIILHKVQVIRVTVHQCLIKRILNKRR
jgi:hypothetical protein